MKKQQINAFLFFLLILFSLDLKNSIAQNEINWENFTPERCGDGEGIGQMTSQFPYVGPKSYRFCPDGPTGCCFTIIYYDRMYPGNLNERPRICDDLFFYDLSVTGIFYEDENCKNYDKTDIIEKFHLKIYQVNSQRQGFRDSVTKCCNINGLTNGETNLQTKLICKDTNGIQCDNLKRCCNNGKQPLFTMEGNNCVFDGWYLDPGPHPPEPACPDSCTPKCNDVYMEHISVTACDMPCNWGEWSQNKTVTYVPDPSCPACVVTITYKDRSTTGCNPNYKDYKIENISYPMFGCNAPLCHSLVTVNNALMAYSMNFLLNHLVENLNLLANECEDNIRIMKTTCFEYVVDGGGNHWLYPCDKEYCCWVNLRICKTESGHYTKTILQSSGVNEFFDCGSPQSSNFCTSYCFHDWFQPQTFNTNIDFINYLLNNYKETK